jgi:hypothetical protein
MAQQSDLVEIVMRGPGSTWMNLIMPVAYLIFLLWLRRYFPRKGFAIPEPGR